MMDLIRNFPAISILLCLFAGIISSGFHGKPAKYINLVLIMLLSICGGVKKLVGEVAEEKRFLYYVLTDLLLSSLLALVYTNDLFTAYVFVEINTIAACGLIMIRQNGRP